VPFAVALLSHPAGAYACLVASLAASVYAWHTQTFVPAFTAASAAMLTTLAFLHAAPDPAGLLFLAVGVALLQTEFVQPTYGAALMTGIGASIAGSWLLLSATSGATAALAPALRGAIALGGTLVLLAAVVRGFRLRTLER
jgi:membrane-bound ClpP family serine protease